MNEKERLMNLIDQFFDRDLMWVGAMLDQRREDGNHKLSMTILEKLNKKRENLSGAEVTRRRQDMRAWWVEYKWRPIQVLQFNFNVMMHFFRLCHGKLQDEDKWFKLFDEQAIAKLNQIETLLMDYITVIERRPDYKEEIPNSRQWFLNYALEYAQLIWDEQKNVTVGQNRQEVQTDVASSSKRPRPDDLGMLLERLRLSAGAELG
jgi:hypothetical protein